MGLLLIIFMKYLMVFFGWVYLVRGFIDGNLGFWMLKGIIIRLVFLMIEFLLFIWIKEVFYGCLFIMG